jgi:hypothetical protein
LPSGLAGDGVVGGLADDAEHLEHTAGGQVGGVVGAETVEAAVVAGVLGLVDDAGLGVGCDGLVREASHRVQRHRRSGRFGRDRDEEVVPVSLRPPIVGARHRLFRREPARFPVGNATGAVHDRSVQADELVHDLHLTGVEVDGDRPANTEAVVLASPEEVLERRRAMNSCNRGNSSWANAPIRSA